MTQEEIIEMARQALKQEPREDWNSTAWVFADETLEAFAKLVAAREREEFAVHAVDIARRAVAKERKACAQIGDGFHDDEANCGDLIRARGQA